jgi:hypothetical protein
MRLPLLDALLTRKIPSSIVGDPLPRVHEGTYPTDLEIDGDGYPNEDRVDEIGMVAMVDARRWLHDEFSELWASIPSAGISGREVQDTMGRAAKEIRIATGGWSGCESVIDAVLKHVMMARYCTERRVGGGYTFVVPHED